MYKDVGSKDGTNVGRLDGFVDGMIVGMWQGLSVGLLVEVDDNLVGIFVGFYLMLLRKNIKISI